MIWSIIPIFQWHNIVDLFCNNGFLKAMSYQSQRPEMWWEEVHFKQNISIYSMFIEDDLLGWTQRCQYNVTLENNDNTCMLISHLLLDNIQILPSIEVNTWIYRPKNIYWPRTKFLEIFEIFWNFGKYIAKSCIARMFLKIHW